MDNIAEKLQIIQDGINTEGDLISQIAAALEGKGGSSETNNLKTCKIDFTLNYPVGNTGIECLYTTVENEKIVIKTFLLDISSESFTIKNIVPNTILYFLTIDTIEATSLGKSDDISILDKDFSSQKLVLMIGENDGYVNIN